MILNSASCEAASSPTTTARSCGYYVSTVGLDEEMIRAYVRDQEHLDKLEELDFSQTPSPF